MPYYLEECRRGAYLPFSGHWTRGIDIARYVTHGQRVANLRLSFWPYSTATDPWLVLYSFPIPLRVQGWVGLSSCWHTEMAYLRMPAHLSTNQPRSRISSLTWSPSVTLSEANTKQLVKVIRHNTASPPNKYGSIVFTRLQQCAPYLVHLNFSVKLLYIHSITYQHGIYCTACAPWPKIPITRCSYATWRTLVSYKDMSPTCGMRSISTLITRQSHSGILL